MNTAMFKQLLSFALALCLSATGIQAQNEDPVLFSVDGVPVAKSEFVYIYSKTNGKNADFSERSLKEYLDLYVKFKLKVAKAREMQLDTIPELMRELEGYRRQLADSYLIDKEVTEKLNREAYERVQQDVDISHILVAVGADAEEAAAEQARLKIMNAKKRIEQGAEFEAVAKEISDDKSAQNNGGHIGYVTALFPNGFYELEKAAYTAPIGELYGPLRTDAGFHLLMVHGRRAARGEIEAGHILIRTGDGVTSQAAKARIDSAYQALQNGADFEALAKAVSEDLRTAAKGGYIGFFGINQYSRDFEDAAFGLAEDGAYTQPVQTSVGWHIIRRVSLRGIQPYSIEKGRLENAVKKDNRFEQAKIAMVERIKKDADMKEYPKVLDAFASSLTDTFLTFRWRAPETPSGETLITFGEGYDVTLGDFTSYLERSSRQRLRMGRGKDVKEAVQELYTAFVDESAMRYEEKQLEAKYPDFKALMREYEEGILLFEATKMLVWDKASQDSVGLEKFFKRIRGKYRYGERAKTSIYKVANELSDQMDEIRAFMSTHTPEEVLAKYNTGEGYFPEIRHESKTLDKDLYPEFKNMEWKVGALSQSEPLPQSSVFKVIKIEEILEPRDKTLEEARGYVVADYQDYLEEEWVESLRKAYPVKINDEVFQSMIEK
ncbi:peptidylprolyl isomerase [Phaeodactylibacter luteus]|nr:peptidylprolyl isomerase [Phaeodactylibacter luteus]